MFWSLHEQTTVAAEHWGPWWTGSKTRFVLEEKGIEIVILWKHFLEPTRMVL